MPQSERNASATNGLAELLAAEVTHPSCSPEEAERRGRHEMSRALDDISQAVPPEAAAVGDDDLITPPRTSSCARRMSPDSSRNSEVVRRDGERARLAGWAR